MSDRDKALFRGAQDRNLAALVPPQANNQPVAAYPNFVAGTAPGTSQIVVLRWSVAEIVNAVIVGTTNADLPGRLSIQIDEDSEPPLVFQRARWINPSPPGVPVFDGDATTLDPNADPEAVAVDAQWVSIPTFLMGQQRVGVLPRRTMQFIRLRRTITPRNRIVSFALPPRKIPLHPSDVAAGLTTLTRAHLTDPDQVPVMMRAVHAYAVSKGYAAGVPGFAEGDQQLLQIMLIREAEVVEVPTVRIFGPPFWRCFDVPIGPQRELPGIQLIVSMPANLAWTVVGSTGFAPRVVMQANARLYEYSNFPQPPAYEAVPDIPPATLDGGGRPGRVIRGEVSGADDGSMLHILYYDGSVMHATRGPAAADTWSTQVVDNVETDGQGLCTNALALRPTPGGVELHAFYTTGNGVLRHAQFDGTTWTTEALDGHVTDNEGRVDSTFEGVAAVAEPDGRLHVFYHDVNATNLRHAERQGTTWRFEVLDGSGGTPVDGPGTGPISGHVGMNPGAAWYDNRVYVFYDDTGNENIRMAVRRSVGAEDRWSYRPLDGAKRGRGSVSSLVRATTTSVWNDRLSVFYYDADRGHLRHASATPGWATPWNFEIVDGVGGLSGRISGLVGAMPAAVVTALPGAAPSLPLMVVYLGPDYKLRLAILSDPP